MSVGVEVRLSLGLATHFQIKIGSGSLTTNLEFFEDQLNTDVGWGQIKVGVDNSFPTPE